MCCMRLTESLSSEIEPLVPCGMHVTKPVPSAGIKQRIDAALGIPEVQIPGLTPGKITGIAGLPFAGQVPAPTPQ